MELPNLLNKLKSTSEEIRKFLAIEIGLDVVKTAIWQSTGTHTEVVSVGSVQAVDMGKADDLLSAIDASLIDAQSTVSEEPDQVIFGLPETWVNGEGIVESKKSILKTICAKLGLKAIGFVVSNEAVIHHLRDLEGGPPSALLIRASSQEIGVSLVYLGKLKSTQSVSRSVQFAADVEEGIARIPHTGHLPSRMILLADNEDTETLKQELISFDWQKRLQFLHIPKVESLAKDWSIRAIAIAGGGEVVSALGIASLIPKEASAAKSVTPAPEAAALENLKKETEAGDTQQVKSTDFGFTTVTLDDSEDYIKKPERLADENEVEEEPEELVLMEHDNVEPALEEETQELNPPSPILEPSKEPHLLLGFGQRLKSLVKKPSNLSSRPKINPKAAVLVLAAILVIVVGVGLVSAYSVMPRATIDIAVALNQFQQPLTFKVDPQAETTVFESLTMAGKKQVLEKTGSKELPATGTKTVGDRAKGKVVIYNRTTASKTFKAGETIKSNNLKYVFDTSVTVASASTKENADFSLTTEPSKTEAAVTAADIGDQYNLAKDTQFAVANYSQDSFVAVAANSFSGGSSRKVAAVAKEDVAQVKKELIEELQQSLSSAADEGQQSGYKQLVVGEPEILKEDYSAETGEEATSVKLDLTMSQVVYVYDVNELTMLAQQSAQNALPQNVQIKPDSTQVSIMESEVADNDVATINAQITIQYIPSLNVAQYQKALSNTSIKELDAKLRTIPNFMSYSISSSKWLVLNRLPLKTDQIDIRVFPGTR